MVVATNSFTRHVVCECVCMCVRTCVSCIISIQYTSIMASVDLPSLVPKTPPEENDEEEENEESEHQEEGFPQALEQQIELDVASMYEAAQAVAKHCGSAKPLWGTCDPSSVDFMGIYHGIGRALGGMHLRMKQLFGSEDNKKKTTTTTAVTTAPPVDEEAKEHTDDKELADLFGEVTDGLEFQLLILNPEASARALSMTCADGWWTELPAGILCSYDTNQFRLHDLIHGNLVGFHRTEGPIQIPLLTAQRMKANFSDSWVVLDALTMIVAKRSFMNPQFDEKGDGRLVPVLLNANNDDPAQGPIEVMYNVHRVVLVDQQDPAYALENQLFPVKLMGDILHHAAAIIPVLYEKDELFRMDARETAAEVYKQNIQIAMQTIRTHPDKASVAKTFIYQTRKIMHDENVLYATIKRVLIANIVDSIYRYQLEA